MQIDDCNICLARRAHLQLVQQAAIRFLHQPPLQRRRSRHVCRLRLRRWQRVCRLATNRQDACVPTACPKFAATTGPSACPCRWQKLRLHSTSTRNVHTETHLLGRQAALGLPTAPAALAARMATPPLPPCLAPPAAKRQCTAWRCPVTTAWHGIGPSGQCFKVRQARQKDATHR